MQSITLYFLPRIRSKVSILQSAGYWATLSLSIGDFTRFARSQRAQAVGQTLGLPLFMAAFSFVGLAVTSATIQITGAPVYDPVDIVALIPGKWPVCLGLLGMEPETSVQQGL
jgi:NCS1 family nucleobase:cation symporter-1